jgi:hypothetical protein
MEAVVQRGHKPTRKKGAARDLWPGAERLARLSLLGRSARDELTVAWAAPGGRSIPMVAPVIHNAVPILFVRDVSAAASFYESQLGFQIDFLAIRPLTARCRAAAPVSIFDASMSRISRN